MRRELFTYWHQGLEQAPPVVKMCVHRMRSLHPEWDVRVLDAKSVSSFIDPIPIADAKWQRMRLAHRSDLIRTQLLIRYGGVWADPTVFFARPLDGWLEGYLGSGLFMFHRPGPDRVVSAWLIAAEPQNVVLRQLYSALCGYWSRNEFSNLDGHEGAVARWVGRLMRTNLELPRLWLRRPVIALLRTAPYMVYHYQFYDLVRSDAQCAQVWARTPRISADGPHRLLRYGLGNPATALVKTWIDEAHSPLFKLTWKTDKGPIPAGSVLEYLFEKAGVSVDG